MITCSPLNIKGEELNVNFRQSVLGPDCGTGSYEMVEELFSVL